MKILAPMILLSFLLPAAPVEADTSVRLKVSATIPPRPCDIDDDDDCQGNQDRAVAAELTKVIVDNGRVLYVGSSPEVTKTGDLVSVIF